MSSLGIFDKETKTYKKVADLSKPAVIDSAMSNTSTNPVQNKVVKSYIDNGVNSSKKLQTYKQGSTTETYGDSYPIYAQWRDTGHVKMKCDNYTVETDYATSAGSASSVTWNNISGKPSTYTPSSHTHDDRYYTESEINTKLNNKANVFKYEFSDHDVYRCLGTATLRQEGDYLILHIYCGSGFNANIGQDRTIDVHIRTSNGIAENGKYYIGYIESHLNGATNCNVYVVQNSSTSFTIWIGKLNYSGRSFYEVQFPNGDSWVSETNTSTTIPTNGVALIEKKIAYTDYVDDGLNTLKKSVSDGKTKVANAITDKGVETATDATFDVMAENISKIETGGGELHGATLAVSTAESTLFGKTVTLTLNGASVGTTTFADNGTCSFVVQNPGTYTITCGEAHKDATVTGDNVVNKTVISVELSLFKIVTFADGTDEEIAKMVQAHYNDKINIANYWAVGDTRSVSLSAMSATGVGESHRAQTVQFVIGDFEHDDLVTSINGHTKAAVTLLQKDCLMDATSASNSNNGSNDTEKGYMNSTNTNSGGWKSCARRTWCNNVYFSALPSAWQSMVKTVSKKVSVGNNQSTIETVQDKIFLAAEIEIFGSTTYSVSGEGTQYQYYKNATANRYKMPKWNSAYVSNIYWERSPYSDGTYSFCDVYSDGNPSAVGETIEIGVAPCLCI